MNPHQYIEVARYSLFFHFRKDGMIALDKDVALEFQPSIIEQNALDQDEARFFIRHSSFPTPIGNPVLRSYSVYEKILAVVITLFLQRLMFVAKTGSLPQLDDSLCSSFGSFF